MFNLIELNPQSITVHRLPYGSKILKHNRLITIFASVSNSMLFVLNL